MTVRVLGLGRGECMMHRRPRTGTHRNVTGRGSHRQQLEQWRVNDPHEMPTPRRRSCQVSGRSLPARRPAAHADVLTGPAEKEHAVTGFRADVRGESGTLSIGEILGNRPAEGAVLAA